MELWSPSSCLRLCSTTEMKKWLAIGGSLFIIVVVLLRLEIFEENHVLKSRPPAAPSFLHLKQSSDHHAAIHSGTDAPAPDEQLQNVEEVSKTLEQPQKPNETSILQTFFLHLRSNDSLSEIVSTWKYLLPAFDRPDMFPEGAAGLKEAEVAWPKLIQYMRSEALYNQGNDSFQTSPSNQCPYSVSSMNNEELQRNDFVLHVPCGLVLDSSITIIGVSMGAEGDFAINLFGPKLPGEINPPIILHYNIRLLGDQLTRAPVIVQNSRTRETSWGEEDRCPTEVNRKELKVDGLHVCNKQVGTELYTSSQVVKDSSISMQKDVLLNGRRKPWFPISSGLPFAATLRAGQQGFHMTIDGKHITSFEYRKNLEPSLVSSVKLRGTLKPISVIATGLPTSENITEAADLELLRAPPVAWKKKRELFIGVFSTSNNFDQRMAVRRSWMQYEAVRSGQVAVRFFIGMHNNEQVNKEIALESLTYGDVQLMPFVDYYNLISLKTIAICTFGVKMAKTKYIMKADDDTFIRVDEILNLLNKTRWSKGLLYGNIEYEDQPNRDPGSKWYVSNEEWPLSVYPPWAHGPGYIISNDVANFIFQSHSQRKLKLFKLEDVAMGMWIKEYETQGHVVHYENRKQFYTAGCSDGYVIAHYQNPRLMTCLWQGLLRNSKPVCCK